MRLARVQHALLLALANGEGRNRGALVSFNAGTSHILGANREATDTELLALETLADQVTTAEVAYDLGHADADALIENETSDGEEDHSLDRPPSSSEGAEGDASASQDEVTQPGAGASVSAPSVSAGAEALNRAADFQAQRPLEHVVEADEPVNLGLTETVHSPPFQPQEDTEAEHLEDDGA